MLKISLLSTTLLEYAYFAFLFNFAIGKVYNSLLLIVVNTVLFVESNILHFVPKIILFYFILFYFFLTRFNTHYGPMRDSI